MICQYDPLITEARTLFSNFSSLKTATAPSWESIPREELILKGDAAFELGGNGASATSGIFFTTNLTMVPESNVQVCDQVFTCPQNFNMESSINYAKFVFVRLKADAVENKDSQQLYGLFRKLEYVRYHAYLKGFAIRISSAQHREVSRVSAQAVKEGVSLDAIAQAFKDAYLSIPEVEAVQIYIAAIPKDMSDSGAFKQLEGLSLKSEAITDSLNVIFKGLKMDCSTCGQKELCDEIDGIKDLHKSMLGN